MANIYPGINNDNEFYTDHYIAAILQDDLKDLFKKWNELDEDQKPPYALLRSLRKDYFSGRSQWEKEKDPNELRKLQRPVIRKLLTALDYQYKPDIRELENSYLLPIIGEIKRPSGAPELWIIEALDKAKDGENPLSLSLDGSQFPKTVEPDKELLELSFEEIIGKLVFGRSEPPRWVILVGDRQLLLLDRSKWNAKRLLRFDINEILDRREDSTLKAMAALLHRDSVCPAEGLSLLDTLDENSHKHAHAVSEDLKYALREAIEILGNEAIYYLREVRKEKIYEKDLAKPLTVECLRYMYRLLFMFYIEARPELGYAPIKSDAYRTGYSLETLRDLEMVQLTMQESKDGIFIHESLKLLFKLVYEGYPKAQTFAEQLSLLGESERHSFNIPPLRSHLFDPERTPTLNKCRFRNEPMQKIICLMSLSKPAKGRKGRRGRISYAQLGINQLGAVYEALLCYQGFFAETDLYEVKKAKEIYDPLKMAYFVKKEDLAKYDEDEKVYIDSKLVQHDKGTFIYRLAGRDRQKSASYYTPEVLTQCLVKYALKELLKDKTADEILNLKVCEPAMGSAAFLNEAVNQLSEAYFELKQKELGETIPLDAYAQELQKVKTYIADNNVFGVDLNPVAVELAEVSLWLNTIHEGGFVPWFGMQLICGNSLVGARRQVFDKEQLKKGSKESWLKSAPERVMPGDQRPEGTIYHFLVPDEGMANYKDKVVKSLAENEIKKINAWRKEFCKPFSAGEIRQLTTLSEAIDKLWTRHAEDQRKVRRLTTDQIALWGQPKPKNAHKATSTHWKDAHYEREILTKGFRHSSAYRRLKLAMDYWCALWFWPIRKAELLPSRNQFMHDLSLILKGDVLEDGDLKKKKQLLFEFLPESVTETERQEAFQFVDEYGYVDVDKLCGENQRLGLVQELNQRHCYHHWELEFADLFDADGGFDLVLGNPPWIKVEWREADVLGEFEPLFVVRKYSANKLSKLRNEVFSRFASDKLREQYVDEFVSSEGQQIFLNAAHNYNMLEGMKANLYKCFIPLAWSISSHSGVSGFVTYEGIYNDPNGGVLRELCYKRLRYWFYFENEKSLFKDIGHAKKFEINIFGIPIDGVRFDLIANVYHPITIDNCYDHTGVGVVPGKKTDDNVLDLAGHTDRIIQIDSNSLEVFAKAYDEPGTRPLRARLAALHSKQLMAVLERFANYGNRINDIRDQVFTTQHWNETASQQDGTIKRDTSFPDRIDELIISGPHFYVATPLNKTPRHICTEKGHYNNIDLTEIRDDYLPRTNYRPACSLAEYTRRTPRVTWTGRGLATDYYRIAFRAMIGPHAERTLIGAIVPPGLAHINGVQTAVFADGDTLLKTAAVCSSIVADYFVKSTGRSNLHATWMQLPLLGESAFTGPMRMRMLGLTAVTKYYSNLWSHSWSSSIRSDSWSKTDVRLSADYFEKSTKEWKRECGLRTLFARRQALVEIDVLVSMALGLSVEDLNTIYRVQFPVLRQYENDTWYDQFGRVIFTNNRGLSGVGISRKEWEEVKEMKSDTVEQEIEDDTKPGGPKTRTIIYHAPFDRCDREKDYEIAWKEFERRFKEEGN